MNITYEFTQRECDILSIFANNSGWLFEGDAEHFEHFKAYESEIDALRNQGIVCRARRWVDDMDPLALVDFLTELGKHLVLEIKRCPMVHVESAEKFSRVVYDADPF